MLNKSIQYTLITLCFFTHFMNIQAQAFEPLSIPIFQNNQQLQFPLTGGLNNPQFATPDLNKDGIPDLYIFDACGQVSLTFLHQGIPNTTASIYAPTYAQHFPKMQYWMHLIDFNGDHISDLFTYSKGKSGIKGVRVFKGSYNLTNELTFQPISFWTNRQAVTELFYTEEQNPDEQWLILNASDYPAITDIDGDGDIDILAFHPSGSYVEYYQNQAVELNVALDSLCFKKISRCWGGFLETGLTAIEPDDRILLSDTIGHCPHFKQSGKGRTHSPKQSLRTTLPKQHGAATLLAFDQNADGDQDLYLSDISSNKPLLLLNSGTKQEAWITRIQSNFPQNSLPINIPALPLAFYLDVNNDQQKDLIVAPYFQNTENYEVAWYYKNTSSTNTPNFQFQQKHFLTEQMLDFGSETHPAIVDYNADGLLDIIIGTKGRFLTTGGYASRLIVLENRGSPTLPQFDVVAEDWLQFSQFQGLTEGFTPTFGDLDNDGDQDLVVGDILGRLFFAQNTALPQQVLQFPTIIPEYMDIDVGQFATPQLIDVNRDGLVDLLIGNGNGNIAYFENQGAPQQAFFTAQPTVKFWGNIETRELGVSMGHAAPFLWDSETGYHLWVGTEGGQIQEYRNIEDNLNNTFLQTNAHIGTLSIGTNIQFALADLNKDNILDIIAGNTRGGLSIFSTDVQTNGHIASTSPLTIPPTLLDFSINIQQNQMVIQGINPYPSFPITLSIYDTWGQLVWQKKTQQLPTTLSLKKLSIGIYFLQVTQRQQQGGYKFYWGHPPYRTRLLF